MPPVELVRPWHTRSQTRYCIAHTCTHTASYTRQHKLTRQVIYLPLTSPPLQGAYLILVARREAELQRVRSEVSADASRVRTLVLDVGKLDEVW